MFKIVGMFFVFVVCGVIWYLCFVFVVIECGCDVFFWFLEVEIFDGYEWEFMDVLVVVFCVVVLVWSGWLFVMLYSWGGYFVMLLIFGVIELFIVFGIILVLFGLIKLLIFGKGFGEGICNFCKGFKGDEFNEFEEGNK